MTYYSENGSLLYKELRQEIGSENTIKVFRLLAGQQIYFPECILREFRNRALLKDYRAGMSYGDLARKYRLTEKHIRHITSPGHTSQASEANQTGRTSQIKAPETAKSQPKELSRELF